MLNVKSNYGTNKGSEELCQVLFLAQLQGFFALWNTLRFSLCASACLGFCSVEDVAFQNSRSLKKKQKKKTIMLGSLFFVPFSSPPAH